MNNNLHLAKLFLTHYPGAVLFPAFWDGKQHVGFVSWRTESSSDPAVIESWGNTWPQAHFCLNRVPSNMVVLDIDIKGDKDGRIALQSLIDDFGALPDTLTATTPSGGFHYLMHGEAATNYSKAFGKGIDVPAMIPLPGQTVRGKGEYRIENPALISDAPAWVTRIAGPPVDKAENRNMSLVDLDQGHHIADAVAFLQQAPLAVEGDGGDNTTYTTVCRVRDFGISEETALQLMLRMWNPRCSPPWDPQELEVKVRNAYSYAASPIGASTAEAVFNLPLPQPISPVISMYDDDEEEDCHEFGHFTQSVPPERNWVVGEWIPEGEVSSLYGHGGLGKSLLAVQLGAAISKGLPFLGLPIEQKMPVLGVFAEDSTDELHRRAYSYAKSAGYVFSQEEEHELFPFLAWSRAQRDSTLASIEAGGRCRKCPFYEKLTRKLESMGPGKKFLILDTLTDLFAGQENDREAANKFIKVVLGSFVRAYNCTVLLLAHPSVSGMARKDIVSGSTAWNNAVRNRLALEAHKTYEDYRILTRAKSNYSRAGEKIDLKWERGVLVQVSMADVVDEREEANKDILFEEVRRQAATGTPYGMHAQARVNILDIKLLDADEQEMSKEVKRRLINELIVEGVITKVTKQSRGNGLWPTDRGGVDDFANHDTGYNPFENRSFTPGSKGAA